MKKYLMLVLCMLLVFSVFVTNSNDDVYACGFFGIDFGIADYNPYSQNSLQRHGDYDLLNMSIDDEVEPSADDAEAEQLSELNEPFEHPGLIIGLIAAISIIATIAIIVLKKPKEESNV